MLMTFLWQEKSRRIRKGCTSFILIMLYTLDFGFVGRSHHLLINKDDRNEPTMVHNIWSVHEPRFTCT